MFLPERAFLNSWKVPEPYNVVVRPGLSQTARSIRYMQQRYCAYMPNEVHPDTLSRPVQCNGDGVVKQRRAVSSAQDPRACTPLVGFPTSQRSSRRRHASSGAYSTSSVHPYLTVLRLLQWMGFFPTTLGPRGVKAVCVRVFFCFLTLTYVAVNLTFFGLNVNVTTMMRQQFRLLHPYTMTSIITGMLPLQNALNMILFFFGVSAHVRLLKDIQSRFSDAYTTVQERRFLRSAKRKLYIVLALSAGIPLVARIIQVCIATWLMHAWHGPVSLVIVPVLRCWQIIPLLYFDFLCASATALFKRIRQTIILDPKFEVTPLSQHFSRFRSVTLICIRISNFLSPFVFFSIIFAVLNLVITVYFFTNAKDFQTYPPNANPHWRQQANTAFDLAWGGIQVVIAITYAIFICRAGWTANQQARRVLAIVLASQPRNEEDRFQVLRFQELLHTQLTWGVTVWKAFAIERGFFFTISSTIIAYTLILLRMKNATHSDTYSAIEYCLNNNHNLTSMCSCMDGRKLQARICEHAGIS